MHVYTLYVCIRVAQIMSMGKVEQVSENLDRVLLELMSSLQQLAELRKKYGAAVREGYFGMAKARYASGPKSVGTLQYDATMVPLVHVNTSKHPSSYEECSGESGELEFEINRIQPGKSVVSHDQKSSESEESQLRRRKPKPKSPTEQEGDGVEDFASAKEGGTLEEDVREAKDPLKWFGILVPQALRHSQHCFVQAINHCAELVTAQARVEALRRKYCMLVSEKAELKHSSVVQTSSDS